MRPSPRSPHSRALKAAPAGALAFQAASHEDTVALTLVADDLQLAKEAALFHGGDEIARVPLEVGQTAHKVSGIETTDLEARLLDRYGNVIARVAVTPAADTTHEIAVGATRAAPAAAPTALTYVGAGLLGVGVLGMTASSVGVAVIGGNVLNDQPLLVAGLFGSGGAFLAGAALVVVDQGLSP